MATKKRLDELITRAPFENLFEIEKEMLEVISKDIKEHGYDSEKPVFAWKHEGDLVVLDGHTRVKAARKARIKEIPVVARQFADEDEAWQFAFAQQAHRRNISQVEIVERLEARRLAQQNGNLDSDKVSRSRIKGAGKGDRSLRGSTKDPAKAEIKKKAEAIAGAPINDRTVERGRKRARDKAAGTTTKENVAKELNQMISGRRQPRKAKPRKTIMGYAEGTPEEMAEETISYLAGLKLTKVKIYLGEEITAPQLKRLEAEIARLTKDVAEIRAIHDKARKA